ncbi:uncharacterized protein LOC113128432 [Mastacembelus armatus]|uniref:Uncharacterized LOC113128432 n=1 Tax=Mastacembelus armatus TaxID=205130 RepID=A0A3Q3RQW7_9TELE|nr:uncharacterized protein LOC113128432 [Mastacembelus armatus]XP_026159545.1 uncharacterized protein LOC113128432 [Mastacembelus armatus]
MERNKKTHVFFLLTLVHVSAVRMDCPKLPDNNLTCYTDYNHIITCVWNSTYVAEHEVCKIYAQKKGARKNSKFAKRECDLKPFDDTTPALKKCSMDLNKRSAFQTSDMWSINLRCDPVKPSLNISFTIPFKPHCQIKLNPPEKPEVNFTTVSLLLRDSSRDISIFRFELEWKQENLPWSDLSVQKKTIQGDANNKAELDPDMLIKGERYEARTRVQTGDYSIPSDWSPSALWVSPIGKPKPPPSDVVVGVSGIVITVAVTFTLILAVVFLKADKTTWVYIVKKIRGPPIPNPASSFLQDGNFQDWFSPHFSSESFQSFLKPVEFASVEVTSKVDVVAPCKAEVALLEKMRCENSYESTSSSFSNPSYSHLCPPPPISSLTAGNLEPCAADTPYGPVGKASEAENTEQDKEEDGRKETEILALLSKCSRNNEPVQMISDYEKVEKSQIERFRLQSLDSGVCSGEEVSEESLETDSISVMHSHDEGPERKKEEEKEKITNGIEQEFQNLFGGSGGIIGKGSIQVCSDYECVQKLQPDSPELPSLDSGVSSGEEQVSLEDVDKATESTRFLFPPPPPFCPLPCSMPSFPQLPLKFSGPDPALLPLPSQILARIALSPSKSVEPSGDGYMPVRQDTN